MSAEPGFFVALGRLVEGAGRDAGEVSLIAPASRRIGHLGADLASVV
ncbi:hypothetical protein [Demequina sp.]